MARTIASQKEKKTRRNSVNDNLTFWDHLEELRGSIIRSVIATVICGIIVFLFKDTLFSIILAPQGNTFVTYRILERLANVFGMEQAEVLSPLTVRLINTGLAKQFLIHVKTSLGVGVLLSSPYILYLVCRFISPALYKHERRYAWQLIGWGYIMFLMGVLLGYFLIFPLTFRFLGTYQISHVVENTVTIESYIDTLIMMSLSMGIIFEIPILCWIMGKMGIISAQMMKHYRRHVIVFLLILAAIITPTSDVFTLLLVSMPMWLLYEASIHIVKRVNKDTER